MATESESDLSYVYMPSVRRANITLNIQSTEALIIRHIKRNFFRENILDKNLKYFKEQKRALSKYITKCE